MIESKELRIGNLIYNPVQKINLVVDGGLIATESMREKAVKDYKGFEPIPLTEEWLDKFGFEEYSKHINGDFELCIKSDKPSHHIVVRIYRGGFSVFNHSECDFTQIQFINRVKHVHQLQNLYFALTGEELKIK